MKYAKKYTSDISDVDNMDGFEFEAFCCELLKQNGYTNVRKTQASGDYGLDVIATTKDGFVCGVQCKNYQGTVGIAAIQEAKTGSEYYNCDIAIVLTNSSFTKAAVQVAQKTNVKLWDRNKLQELIQVFPAKDDEAVWLQYERYKLIELLKIYANQKQQAENTYTDTSQREEKIQYNTKQQYSPTTVGCGTIFMLIGILILITLFLVLAL